MDVRFWAATDVGRTRDHNEDNFLVDKKLNLFIVADGMGGHAAGEVASSVAVRELRRIIAESRELVEDYGRDETPDGRRDLLELIERAFEQACARIFRLAQESPERRGMGTTLSILLIAGRRGFIGHVGDSRIYLLRSGQVHQLTEDHSLVNELIKRGRLKPGDVFDSPYKNAVTRAVGVYESVEVDTLDFDILPGDSYLLCSDGLSCYLDNDILRTILGGESVKEMPDHFIQLANSAGGKDNITSVVVRIQPEADEHRSERMTEVRLKLDTLRAIPLFKYLTYKGLVKVMNITESRRFRAGQVIFEEDKRGEEFYVIIRGRVRVTKGETNLAELGPGGHFGEMALVDKSPRSAGVTAVEDVVALVIQRPQFFEIMRRDPVLAVKLMWSFIQVLNTLLRMSNNELLVSRETIEALRRHQAGGVVAEVPALDPMVSAVAALPVEVTDELIPGFLFADEVPKTDPLLRMDTPAGGVGHADLDARPGLDGGGGRVQSSARDYGEADTEPPRPLPVLVPPPKVEDRPTEVGASPAAAPGDHDGDLPRAVPVPIESDEEVAGLETVDLHRKGGASDGGGSGDDPADVPPEAD